MGSRVYVLDGGDADDDDDGWNVDVKKSNKSKKTTGKITCYMLPLTVNIVPI